MGFDITASLICLTGLPFGLLGYIRLFRVDAAQVTANAANAAKRWQPISIRYQHTDLISDFADIKEA